MRKAYLRELTKHVQTVFKDKNLKYVEPKNNCIVFNIKHNEYNYILQIKFSENLCLLNILLMHVLKNGQSHAIKEHEFNNVDIADKEQINEIKNLLVKIVAAVT